MVVWWVGPWVDWGWCQVRLVGGGGGCMLRVDVFLMYYFNIPPIYLRNTAQPEGILY